MNTKQRAVVFCFLIIALLVASLALSSCAPTPLPEPTLVPTLMNTNTPAATRTPLPTNTPVATATALPTNTPAPTKPSFTDQFSVSAEVPGWAAGKYHITVDNGSFKFPGGSQATAGSSIYFTETELSMQSGALIVIVGAKEVKLGGKSYHDGDRLTVTSTGQFVVVK